MRYSKVGDFYRVSRITGPTHNLLGIRLATEDTSTITVQKLREAESPSLLDEAQLTQAVLTGVRQANAALGTTYLVGAIQYVPTDTPDLDVYSFLAKSLIEQFVHSAELAVGRA